MNLQELIAQAAAQAPSGDLFSQITSQGRAGATRDGWQQFDMGNNQLYLVNPATREVKRAPVWVDTTVGAHDGGIGGPDTGYDAWGLAPSADNFLDKYSLALVGAGLLGGPLAAGLGGGGAGVGAVGDAAIAGGEGFSALSSAAEGLGGGLTAGTTAGGIGGGGLGTGLTAGATASGIGGGAVGTGLTGAASGALAPGFFAAESLYPIMGGVTAGGVASGATGAASAGGGMSSILSNPQLIGAGLGGLASILGGGSSPAGSTTTVQDIPEWLKPYAMQGLGALGNAYNLTPDGVAPITQQGNDYLSSVISGDYLNSNPYLDAMFDRAAGKVGATVNSQFSGAGRYGSGAHAGVLTEGLGNLATDIYGQNYATERANQQNAAGGSAAFGNNLINQPFLKGQNLLQGVNSIKGGTTTTPYFQNKTGDILSGILGGMTIGGYFQ